MRSAGLPIVCAALALGMPAGGEAQEAASGASVYRAACQQCHGPTGGGRSAAVLGFDDALPDFSDCAFGSGEARADWIAVVTRGGPVRAFSERMPAFGAALTPVQVAAVVDHIKTFCGVRAWPSGDLNFPRPLVTGKAFPENEAVISTAATTEGGAAVVNDLVFERRVGSSSQLEVVVPVAWQRRAGGGSAGGIGDVELAAKRVLFHDDRALILSVGGAVLLPTGSASGGFGSGTYVFESFLSAGAALPRRAFAQLQAGVGLPVHLDRASREAFWRGAIGASVAEGRFGRAWSPMVELLGSTALARGARVEWDVVPQVQATLSTRQHVRASVGTRIPMTQAGPRRTELLAYVLWDFADGPLRQGW